MEANFKEKINQAVKETEAVVYSFLPLEEGCQKTIRSEERRVGKECRL